MTGAELQKRREKLGLNQTALAKLLGTTQNTISRWELEKLQIQNPEMLDLALQTIERQNDAKTQ